MIHSLPSSEPLTAQKLFSKLYVSYYARLVRFASLYVGAMGDAENIVQDFFLYLWERKEILPELQQPDAYLFSAVKHRCLNFLRSQLSIVDRRQPLSDIMEQEFKLKLYSLQLLDDSQMSIDEVEKQICRAIDSLPERCREIFVMSKLKGMKYREIAESLGISQNTVEGQMAIALKNGHSATIRCHSSEYLKFTELLSYAKYLSMLLKSLYNTDAAKLSRFLFSRL